MTNKSSLLVALMMTTALGLGVTACTHRTPAEKQAELNDPSLKADKDMKTVLDAHASLMPKPNYITITPINCWWP